MEILFVHGAGGWVEDQLMAAQLRRCLGVPVSLPRLPAEDMSVAAWRSGIRRHRAMMGPEVVVVAHSFGASIALLDLVDDTMERRPRGVVLMAMPSWSPDCWDVGDYALPAGAQPPSGVPILLTHCTDDPVVPIGHLAEHAARLPGALVHTHDSGGHQFAGRMGAVSEDLLQLLG